ncbi:hypothetical protein ROHU_007577 [Labeo rohita]|uniref:Uncharacterized protein n=1 Tax=Labeo rohita TaxID=84645 RepID=A0A498MGF0_LABRO|nr:hypothetical protein ROHU_007577 [Labeo rohita]
MKDTRMHICTDSCQSNVFQTVSVSGSDGATLTLVMDIGMETSGGFFTSQLNVPLSSTCIRITRIDASFLFMSPAHSTRDLNRSAEDKNHFPPE